MAVMKTSQMPLKVFLLLKWMTSCPQLSQLALHLATSTFKVDHSMCLRPIIGFDETGYVFELNQDDINTFSSPVKADFLAGTGDDISRDLVS